MARSDFGRVQKLPSGKFRARYQYLGSLHLAPHTYLTQTDARAWLVAEKRLISSDSWTPPAVRAAAAKRAKATEAQNIFRTYATTWLDGRHDLRANTHAAYTLALKRHLLPTFGDLAIDAITTADVRAWFNSYGQKTPTARARAYQVLASIMNHAVDNDVIGKSPCRIKGGGIAQVKHEPEPLTLAELFALANAMPAKHYALTLLCGLGGLRFGEAVALRRRDIDLRAGTVRIARGATRTNGVKSVGAPKTNAGKRTISVPTVVIDALADHLKTVASAADSLVFPADNGEVLAPSALYGSKPRIEKRGRKKYAKNGYGFYRARVEIGRPAFHWHDLRHTAASLGDQAEATPKEMQHRLGHTTPTMALRYQHSTAERDKAVADRLQAQIDAMAKVITTAP